MKTEGKFRKGYLVFFGIIILFASIGGVLAVVSHSFSEINWGDPNTEAVIGATGQWVSVNGIRVGDLLSVRNRTAIGFNKGYIPANALEVNGSIYVLGSINAVGSICITGGTCLAGSSTTSSSGAWTTSGNNIYYSTGNVGIGTANPGVKLDVNGSVKLNGDIIANRLCNATGVCINSWPCTSTSSTSSSCSPSDWKVPDSQSAAASVCMDDRPALVYEKDGSIASVYIAGAGTSSNLYWNCGGDPGFGKTNTGKVLFAQWNWINVAGNKSVSVKAIYVDGGIQSGTTLNLDANLSKTYTIDSPSGDITYGAVSIFSLAGAQYPNYRLTLDWPNDALIYFSPYTFTKQ